MMINSDMILFLFSMCLLNILSFTIGARIGQKIVKGEKIQSPIKNPVTSVKEEIDSFEARKQQEYEQILRDNIDSYNGFATGQKDLPR